MAKYMIHVCNDRHWYVNEYLIPSLLSQGIAESDIIKWVDKDSKGCLQSCIDSFASIQDVEGGIWHLQDDVVISSDFKKKTEDNDHGIVCGFCSIYGEERPAGSVLTNEMWYSFPCIRIPNDYAKQFVDWFYKDVIHNPEYHMWIEKKKYDDSLFAIFLMDFYPHTRVLNLKPNIVNHIDYLIGGSKINFGRKVEKVTATYWQEPEILVNLEKALKERNNGQCS